MSNSDLSLHVVQPFRPVTPRTDQRRRERNAPPFELDPHTPVAAEARLDEAQEPRVLAHEEGIGERIDIVA